LGERRGAGVEGFLEAVEGHGRRRVVLRPSGESLPWKDTEAKAAILVWEESFLVDPTKNKRSKPNKKRGDYQTNNQLVIQ
jgi:hypothetical protein